MDHKDTGCEGVNGIHLAEDRVEWRAFLNTAKYHRVGRKYPRLDERPLPSPWNLTKCATWNGGRGNVKFKSLLLNVVFVFCRYRVELSVPISELSVTPQDAFVTEASSWRPPVAQRPRPRPIRERVWKVRRSRGEPWLTTHPVITTITFFSWLIITLACLFNLELTTIHQCFSPLRSKAFRIS